MPAQKTLAAKKSSGPPTVKKASTKKSPAKKSPAKKTKTKAVMAEPRAPKAPAQKARAQKTAAAKQAPAKAALSAKQPRAAQPLDVDSILTTLKRLATKENREGLVRFGIPKDKALGVSMGKLHVLAKKLGKSHELAPALWATDVYEAQLLCAFLSDPALLTPAQMDAWCRDFDNWAICDTLCFHLFDRTPHAFRKIEQWAKKRPEFEKRAAFALLASVALHDKKADSAPFFACLPLIESAATDERNFVKKGVLWALRGVGGRKDPALRKASLELAERLAASREPAARWVGKSALREMAKDKAKGREA